MTAVDPKPATAAAGRDTEAATPEIAAASSEPPVATGRAVEAELLSMSLRAAPNSAGLLVVVGVFLCFALSRDVPHSALATWVLALVGCALLRLVHGRRGMRRIELGTTPASLRAERVRLAAVLCIYGLALSGAYVAFGQLMSSAQQAAMIITIAGFAAGGLTTLSPVPTAQHVYSLSLLAPLFAVETMQAVTEDDRDHGVVAVLVAAMAVMLSISVVRFHARLRDSLTLAVENQQLLDALESANAALRMERDEFQEQASVDGLTGLANRRSFDEHLKEVWQQHVALGRPLTVVLVDIDHFKAYNDTRGHAAGDRCLQRVGRLLRDVVGASGAFAARYGGEEFVLVWPDSAGATAAAHAEQVRVAVASAGFAHGSSPVADHVTVSVGCASLLPGADSTADLLLKAADIALYRAKAKGRNRVVRADPSMFAEAGAALAEATSVTQLHGEVADRQRRAGSH